MYISIIEKVITLNGKGKCIRQDSNLRPLASEANALSSYATDANLSIIIYEANIKVKNKIVT